MTQPSQPPSIDEPFWRAAQEHRLEFQLCLECGYVRWPAAGVCPECLSRDSEWRQSVHTGTVWSYVVYHHGYTSALKERLPYNVALIELDNGVRLLSRLDIAPEMIRIGMRVVASFAEVGGRLAPVFIAAKGASAESGDTA
jgi:uncharacterized OB-fold protein